MIDLNVLSTSLTLGSLLLPALCGVLGSPTHRRMRVAVPAASVGLLFAGFLIALTDQLQSDATDTSMIFQVSGALVAIVILNAFAGSTKLAFLKARFESGRAGDQDGSITSSQQQPLMPVPRLAGAYCSLTSRDDEGKNEYRVPIDDGLLLAMLPTNAYVGYMWFRFTPSSDSLLVEAQCKVSFRPWWGWFFLSIPAAQDRDASVDARGSAWCEHENEGCTIRATGNADSASSVECSAAAAVNPLPVNLKEVQLTGIAAVAFEGQQAIEVVNVKLSTGLGTSGSQGSSANDASGSSSQSFTDTARLGADIGFAIKMPKISQVKRGPKSQNLYFKCESSEATRPVETPHLPEHGLGDPSAEGTEGKPASFRRDCLVDASIVGVRGDPINEEGTFRLTFDLIGERAADGVVGHGYLAGRFDAGGVLRPTEQVTIFDQARVSGQCRGVLHFKMQYQAHGTDASGQNIFASDIADVVVTCDGGFQTEEYRLELTSRNIVHLNLRLSTRCN